MKIPSRIGVTVGEPAGIGADIILDLAQKPFAGEVVVFGCPEQLSLRAHLLNIPLTLKKIDYAAPVTPNGNGALSIHPVPMPEPTCCQTPSASNRESVCQSLKEVYDATKSGKVKAIVTGPVSKTDLHTQSSPFMGHTEFFADCAKVKEVMMAFYHPKCLIGLTTTHIPLKDVPNHVTKERIQKCITLLNKSLKEDFNIPHPHIAILGLNPHAGENGQIGSEEIETIIPSINLLKEQGMTLTGPIAGDTAFIGPNLEKYDGILAMFHDQGLGPLKTLNFGCIVNYTLGLDVIRTSVDHGTAFDIAGTGQADSSGLQSAIDLSFKLIENRSKRGI